MLANRLRHYYQLFWLIGIGIVLFHCSIITVNEQGEFHTTHIRTLVLEEVEQGIDLDRLTLQTSDTGKSYQEVCVFSANGDQWFWLNSVLGRTLQMSFSSRIARHPRPSLKCLRFDSSGGYS